jgi:hypothetical protein
MKSTTTTRAALAFVLLSCCFAAHAQLFRAYLSIAGADSTPCTLPAPCRLLPAALAAVASGGEVWMLDSGNFNTGTVDITKSVTILAVPGAVGSLVAPDLAYAVTLFTGNTRVAFRNVVFRGLGPNAKAIHHTEAYSLGLEDCHFQGAGIFATRTPPAAVARIDIERSSFRDVIVAIEIHGAFRASLVDVQVANGIPSNDRGGIEAWDGANVAIKGGSVTGMAGAGNFGISAWHTNPTFPLTRVLVSGTQISGNDYGIGAWGGAGVTEVILDNAKVTHNATGVTMSPGSVLSRQNNTIAHNDANVTGGTLTPVPPM